MTAQQMFDLTGKTALVTGAGSGIGFAIAECLAENNARVVLADLNPENLERAVGRLMD
jgi:gluconate 5-dehydrogenase